MNDDVVRKWFAACRFEVTIFGQKAEVTNLVEYQFDNRNREYSYEIVAKLPENRVPMRELTYFGARDESDVTMDGRALRVVDVHVLDKNYVKLICGEYARPNLATEKQSKPPIGRDFVRYFSAKKITVTIFGTKVKIDGTGVLEYHPESMLYEYRIKIRVPSAYLFRTATDIRNNAVVDINGVKLGAFEVRCADCEHAEIVSHYDRNVLCDSTEEQSRPPMIRVLIHGKEMKPIGDPILNYRCGKYGYEYDICLNKFDIYRVCGRRLEALEIQQNTRMWINGFESAIMTVMIDGSKDVVTIRGLHALDVFEETSVQKLQKTGGVQSMQSHIQKVIFNPPATVVLWANGDKTVVKAGKNDGFDPEKGLAMAIAKHSMGNQGRYFEEFKKWVEPWREEEKRTMDTIFQWILKNGKDGGNKHA